MIKINSGINYSQIIIETINNIFNALISSIDSSIYSLLDEITFVDNSVLNDKSFEKIFSSTFGITYIANSLLIGFVLYYCTRLMFVYYSGNAIERPYQFLSKSIICAICINFSYFLCQQIVNINYLLSSSILETGNLLNIEISFSSLINQTNEMISSSNFDIFSFSGILKSITTIGLINLLFSYSIRYILIKLFILISPFSILSLTTQSSSWFFRSWLKNFLSLLLIQSLVALILLIIFSINMNSTDFISQIIYISAIFVLTKINVYMRELFGGLSMDFSININSLKSLLN